MAVNNIAPLIYGMAKSKSSWNIMTKYKFIIDVRWNLKALSFLILIIEGFHFHVI